jgi:predicted TIM-barrel fold metal-dependent hydrolase
MLRYAVDQVGSERILFGTDYPICNPGVYIGGVLAEPISDEAKENIFSKNAKRLLGIQ